MRGTGGFRPPAGKASGVLATLEALLLPVLHYAVTVSKAMFKREEAGRT
jgi:hypothetical protein